jgi:hypothetical protein
MAENPQNIIRSWNLQSNFATGPVRQDKLVPPQFGRIRTNFVTTWREESFANLDWAAQNVSVYLPESLRIVSSIYLRVRLPACSNGQAYKAYPALYIIKTVRFLSGGQEVYSCDVQTMLGDYCQSLTEEQLDRFGKTYLGHQDSLNADAREVMIPILLPNSAYGSRNGHDTRGHGVFPAQLGNQRLEIQFTLNTAECLSSGAGQAPTTIKDQCSLMYHEVQMTGLNMKQYSDHRGSYSLVNRRFTELTSGWTEYDTANAVVKVRHSQPQGTVTEIQIVAVADEDDEQRHTFAYIKPTSIKCTADAIVQRDLDTPQKIDIELWQNGFVPPKDFPAPGRLCFASHAAEAAHIYSGGYNMSLASNVDFEFTFAAAVRYRIFAVQLQRVKIDSAGRIRAFLE